MKVLFTVCILLCFTGSVYMQNVTQNCGTNSTCTAPFVCQGGKCKAKIDGTCTANSTDECVMTARPCTSDGTCKCPVNATANTDSPAKTVCTCNDNKQVISMDKTMCVAAKKVDETCTDTMQCLMNGKCHGDKCMCNANYAATSDMTMCRLLPGQVCKNTPDCGENAECNATKICVCKADHINQEGQRCGKKLDATCKDDKECLPNAACENTKCKCKSGFTKEDNFCSGASAVAASVVLLVAALVSSRWI